MTSATTTITEWSLTMGPLKAPQTSFGFCAFSSACLSTGVSDALAASKRRQEKSKMKMITSKTVIEPLKNSIRAKIRLL